MPDPDLKIRGRGWGEGPVIKKVFSVLRASVWSKNKGERRAPRATPLDPPLLSIFLNCGKDLHRFAHHCQHARNNSQHSGANNVAQLYTGPRITRTNCCSYTSPPNVGLGEWYVGRFPQNPILIRVIYLRINTLVWLIMQYGPRTRKYMNLKL